MLIFFQANVYVMILYTRGRESEIVVFMENRYYDLVILTCTVYSHDAIVIAVFGFNLVQRTQKSVNYTLY